MRSIQQHFSDWEADTFGYGYGTSPRFGWLTDQGKALKAFTGRLSVDELTNATAKGDGYVGCAPEYCNCDDEDCRSKNPFWDVKPAANFSRNREQA